MIELLAIFIICISALCLIGCIGSGIGQMFDIIGDEQGKLRTRDYSKWEATKKRMVILFCSAMLIPLVIAFFGSIYISGMEICRLFTQFFF